MERGREVSTQVQTVGEVPMGERRAHVRQALGELALRLGPGGRFPTVQELCLQLGVAKATIDGAVRELRDEGVVWSRRGSGIYVSDSLGTTHIGLVFGQDFFGQRASPFYGMLLDRCEQRARAHRERYSIYFATPSLLVEADGYRANRDLVAALRDHKLQGLLLLGTRGSGEMEWLKRQGIPFAAFASWIDPKVSVVRMDFRQMVELAVDALVARGMRRIALVTSLLPQRKDIGAPDLEAFTASLTRHGLPIRPEWVWDKHQMGTDARGVWIPRNEESGYQAARELLAGDRPEAIICLDDMMTLGVLGACSELGVEVGRDIQIATHVNQGAPGFAGYRDRLLMFEVSADEIADTLFALLEGDLRGEPPPVRQRLISPRCLNPGTPLVHGVLT